MTDIEIVRFLAAIDAAPDAPEANPFGGAMPSPEYAGLPDRLADAERLRPVAEAARAALESSDVGRIAMLAGLVRRAVGKLIL